MRKVLLRTLLVALVCGLTYGRAWSQSPGIGLLMVGDPTNPGISQMEKSVKERLDKSLAHEGLGDDKVHVMSYHFDQPRERQYCERKLGVTASDLPVLAVVADAGYTPTRILFQVRHVQNPDAAVAQITRKMVDLRIAAAGDAPKADPKDVKKKLPTEQEFIYGLLLKDPGKLKFHPDEETLLRVMGDIRSRYVDEISNEALLKGIVDEVTQLLKVAKVPAPGLASFTLDNQLPGRIASAYGSKVNKDVLWFAMVRGALGALKDPYSVLMTPDEWKSLSETMQSTTFGGIGIYIELDRDNKNQLTVVEPIEETPAYKAGLQPGDEIVKIDGKPTQGLDIEIATQRIRGPVDSRVVLAIHRKGVEGLKDYPITRANIKVVSVTSKMLPDNIGYIRMRAFGQDTAEEISNALDKLKAAGAKALIMDLRNNGGGYINAAVDICSLFCKEGDVVVSTIPRGGQREEYKSKGPGDNTLPFVLLVNQFSASASEITAGCLKDHKIATLVGVKTFGKGSVQQIFPFADGSHLKLTIAHFFAPNGGIIHHVGITPDIVVKMEAKDVGKPNDVQLKKAIEVAKEKMAAPVGSH